MHATIFYPRFETTQSIRYCSEKIKFVPFCLLLYSNGAMTADNIPEIEVIKFIYVEVIRKSLDGLIKFRTNFRHNLYLRKPSRHLLEIGRK